jgi:hypothetical protein
MAHFDLKEVRGYGIRTKNGFYQFKKGTPLEVTNQEDIDRFKNETALVEVDQNGNKLAAKDATTVTSRAYRRFREANVLFQEEAEDVLAKAYTEAVQKREQEGVDVNKLLEAVNQDTIKKEEVPVELQTPVDEVKVETSYERKEIHKKVSKQKKKANECDKCGRSFKNKAELEEHLLDHEDEE